MKKNEVLKMENRILRKKLRQLTAEFKEYRETSISWSVEDFLMRAKDIRYKITAAQARKALYRMIHHHDAEYGIGWATLDYYIEEYGVPYKSRIRRKEKILKELQTQFPEHFGNPTDSAEHYTGPEPPEMKKEELMVSVCCGKPTRLDEAVGHVCTECNYVCDVQKPG